MPSEYSDDFLRSRYESILKRAKRLAQSIEEQVRALQEGEKDYRSSAEAARQQHSPYPRFEMQTARELSDLFFRTRRNAWERSDPTVAVVATEQLNPRDAQEVRRIVADAGYQGAENDEMVRRVSALIVGQVEAMDDDMPVDAGGG
jgi:hypothetical protein